MILDLGLGCFGAAVGFFAGKNATFKRVEDIDNKAEMIRFLKKATKSTQSAEYKELYRFLLSVFHRADRDFDGLVKAEDFDLMVEMAGAIPRKFAFAPTSAESFATDRDRQNYRSTLFKKIDKDGSGGISFDEWLSTTYKHIQDVTQTLDESRDADLGMKDKARFREWVIKACRSRKSAEYKELYDVLLNVFVQADTDMDGRVNPAEFDKMIEIAADIPRKFGYAPPASKTYKTTEDRVKARNKMFRDMDTDNNGTITFEEWLSFSYKHICEKAKTLDNSLTGKPPSFHPGQTPPGSCPMGFA